VRERIAKRIWLIAPALIALPALFPTILSAYKSTFATFGRDQGIYQWVAWAITHGERAWVDFREINGPLIYFIHLAMMPIARGDEHVFRVFDVVTFALVGALVGAALPGLGARKTRGHERWLWPLAGAVVLVAQYQTYSWWDCAQRESFYAMFQLAGIACQLIAQHRSAPHARGTSAWLILAGLFGAFPWFGKPTMIAFTVAQVVVLALDGHGLGTRRRRIGTFLLGCAITCIALGAASFAIGDPLRGLAILVTDVPREYRFIWARSFLELYREWGNPPRLNLVFAGLFVGVIVACLSPRRALGFVALLAFGVGTFFLQRKGFPYHLHQASAATHVVFVMGVVVAARRARAGRPAWMAACILGAALIGYRVFDDSISSSAMTSDWDDLGSTRHKRESDAYLAAFGWGDFYARDLRHAGAYIAANTGADERVQLYGMDPYLLYFAQRKSASPFIYGFELNLDAAMIGGNGARPDAEDVAWLRATASAHEDELMRDVESRPPGAFALIDHMPFMYADSSELDLRFHCPRVYDFMTSRYSRAARFGHIVIWLPKDRVASPAP